MGRTKATRLIARTIPHSGTNERNAHTELPSSTKDSIEIAPMSREETITETNENLLRSPRAATINIGVA